MEMEINIQGDDQNINEKFNSLNTVIYYLNLVEEYDQGIYFHFIRFCSFYFLLYYKGKNRRQIRFEIMKNKYQYYKTIMQIQAEMIIIERKYLLLRKC